MPATENQQPVRDTARRKLQMRSVENHRAFSAAAWGQMQRTVLMGARHGTIFPAAVQGEPKRRVAGNHRTVPTAVLLPGWRPVWGAVRSMKLAGGRFRRDRAMGLGIRQNLRPGFPTQVLSVGSLPGAGSDESGLHRKQAFSASAYRTAGGWQASALREERIARECRAVLPPEELAAGGGRTESPLNGQAAGAGRVVLLLER